ncbi:MAG: hypothetical protein ACJA1A_001970 [Saprospiraceae bacterium]|jgi:hypothetical protein
MLISHKYKFIFIHVHRTGGTSIMNLLKRELRTDVDEISEHGNVNSSERILIEENPDYKIIGMVRNPWDRILSWYCLINKWNDYTIEESSVEFQKFLELKLAAKPNDPYFHYNQLDYFPSTYSKRISLYRFEDLEEETKKMFSLINVDVGKIPHTNMTEKKEYQDYYSPESKELVSNMCKRDISYFKYLF